MKNIFQRKKSIYKNKTTKVYKNKTTRINGI